MAFRKSPGSAGPRSFADGVISSCARIGAWGLAVAVRCAISAVVLAVLAMGLLWLRLLQGPLELPAVGTYLADRLNAESETTRVGVSSMSLSLGEGRLPSGLEFSDVTVDTVEGQELFRVPRLRAALRLSDLIHGRVRPVRLTVVEADAQFIRARDGRIRFGLGRHAGVLLDEEGAGTSAEGLDAVQRILDGFVGDGPEIPEMEALDRIEVIGANLTYDDRRDGGSWSTQDADLFISRNAAGAVAVLMVDDIRSGTPGASLRVEARRERGTGVTVAHAGFGRLDTDELARQLPALRWLNAFGATVEGMMSADFDLEGRATNMRGELIAERGTIRLPDGDLPFDQITAEVALDRETEGLEVTNGRLSAGWLQAEIEGVARLDRRPVPEGAEPPPPGVSAQIDVLALRVDRPDIFDAPLVFNRGQVPLRWVPQENAVRLTGGWLAREGLVFRLDGQIREAANGPVTDMRLEVPRMTVQDLIAHWPKPMATNARIWTRDHVPEAIVRDVSAQVRIGVGDPIVAMSFGFEALKSNILDGMSALEEGTGHAFVDLNAFYLTMERAHTIPAPGERLDLDGSVVKIYDFGAPVTPADITIRGQGRSQAVMALINQPPLKLVDKLGLDLGVIEGDATVVADLDFPLIADLRLEEVEAKAKADMTGFAMAFPLGEGAPVDVRADALSLVADTAGMVLKGDADMNGARAALRWDEIFSGPDAGRTVALSGQMTPDLLARLGAEDLPIVGQGLFDLKIAQKGDEDPRFLLDADLAEASIAIDVLDWSKPVGAPARLTAEGTAGSPVALTSVALETGTLIARGSADLDKDGALLNARLGDLILPGRMDVSVDLRFGADRVPEIFVTGEYLNVADLLEGDDTSATDTGAEVDPFRLRVDVKDLQVSEALTLSPAAGEVERDGTGNTKGNVRGRLAPKAPIEITLDLPAQGQGGITMTASDAGEVLRAADLYRDAKGGTLFLNAAISDGQGPDLQGQVRIEGMQVRSRATFSEVLESGGLDDVGQEMRADGIGFRKIWIPFTYDDGVVTLTDAIAVSPLLGLKLNGTLDENSEELDMVGVMSPAYALTGAVNNLPVLGDILAGGEGEGILAMTFTLQGAMRDPDLAVNPLSLLAPGFLRKIFTSKNVLGGTRSRDARRFTPDAGQDR